MSLSREEQAELNPSGRLVPVAECGCVNKATRQEYERGKCPTHPALASLTAAQRHKQLNAILKRAVTA